MEQALTFADPAGRAVSGILASPQDGSDRLVVLCHGFLSNKNSSTNKALTALLLERGLATFRWVFLAQGDGEVPLGGARATEAAPQALAPGDLGGPRGHSRLALRASISGG